MKRPLIGWQAWIPPLGLALLFPVCSGAADRGDPERGTSEQAPAANSSSGEAVAERSAPPSMEAFPTGRAEHSGEGLTVEYLTGRWCFHRESGGGESGVIEFQPDGRSRSGIVWIGTEYRLEEPEDLEAFRRSYPQIVEIEPDRFVGLLSGSYRVVFERTPCPGWP